MTSADPRATVFDLIDFKAVLIIALIFIPLEQLLPLNGEQSATRRHWLNDVFYLLFNGIVIKAGIVLVVGAAMLLAQRFVPEALTAAVQSQPVWLQAIEALLIADIGFYLAHRAFHAVPFLWRLHAIHHSIEEMDRLAAHRVQPVDQILTKSASFLPLFALGFSAEAVLIYVLDLPVAVVFIHSNTRIKFGPLKWLIASPQFHHWHHANERDAYDKNFAGQLPFLDLIGGTLFMPPRMPEKYGVDEPVPQLYHRQLVYPFVAAAEPAAIAEASAAGKPE
ncbi:MAG: sterol desaturase family protein [Mesorhizobium sp.]|nr:MAG: sterol desaturase family protein [Mesorhizobium sp.]